MKKIKELLRTKKATKLYIAVGAVAVTVSALITLFGNWNDIYVWFGLRENAAVVFAVGTGEIAEYKGDVSVHFIDVGQGDCALIITPDKNVLIDSGERDYTVTVMNYLKDVGVTSIDYVIATHPHSDHIGGMGNIINAFCYDESVVIMPELPEELTPYTSSYNNMLDGIYNTGAETVYARPGMTIELYQDAVMEILGPVYVKAYDGLNNYSVVMRFVYGDNSFIFTGDIEADAESDIVDYYEQINTDVLQVAHHGSGTSTTAKFLKFLDYQSGDYAVISVGSPNPYNHPNNRVLNRLLDRNYTVFRTDLHGNIVFDCTGQEVFAYTQKGADITVTPRRIFYSSFVLMNMNYKFEN